MNHTQIEAQTPAVVAGSAVVFGPEDMLRLLIPKGRICVTSMVPTLGVDPAPKKWLRDEFFAEGDRPSVLKVGT